MSTAPAEKNAKAGWSFFPPSVWLREYKPRWLLSDVVAGLTLAAYAVPVAMAYAGLAGLPPVSGIYCYLFAGLGFFLLGTSRQLAVGPTSAIAMLLGSTLLPMAGEDAARLAALAAATALLTALLCFLAWLFRLSQLVYFISETNLVGFKAGAALTIASTQLPKVLGVPGEGTTSSRGCSRSSGSWGRRTSGCSARPSRRFCSSGLASVSCPDARWRWRR